MAVQNSGQGHEKRGAMKARLIKLLLTAHIAASVGWLGAVAGFLVLSIAGLTSHDADVVRGAYLSMNLIGLFLIVPLSLAALLTGLIQSLGTQWGLFRHYWILLKFLLSTGATFLLLQHQFGAVARAASRASSAPPGAFPELGQLSTQLVADAGFALLALLAITTLSVYKPWGRTSYGRRQQYELRQAPAEMPVSSASFALPDPDNGATDNSIPFGVKVFLGVTGVLVLMFGILHHGGQASHHFH